MLPQDLSTLLETHPPLSWQEREPGPEQINFHTAISKGVGIIFIGTDPGEIEEGITFIITL